MTIEDIFDRAEELGYTLTDRQAEQVLMLVEGNWELIDNYINEIL